MMLQEAFYEAYAEFRMNANAFLDAKRKAWEKKAAEQAAAAAAEQAAAAARAAEAASKGGTSGPSAKKTPLIGAGAYGADRHSSSSSEASEDEAKPDLAQEVSQAATGSSGVRSHLATTGTLNVTHHPHSLTSCVSSNHR